MEELQLERSRRSLVELRNTGRPGIDPPFGCTCQNTSVTISSAGSFVSTPIVEMRPHGLAAPVTLMVRVAFVDPTTLTAVVPLGLPLGNYDVTVLNPRRPLGS